MTACSSYFERGEDPVMCLCVGSDAGIAVVDVGSHDVLVHILRHNNKPLVKEIRLEEEIGKNNIYHTFTCHLPKIRTTTISVFFAKVWLKFCFWRRKYGKTLVTIFTCHLSKTRTSIKKVFSLS